MEDAEQRHLSMTLNYIFLFCRRRSGHPFLKHLPNVFFFFIFFFFRILSKKEPLHEKSFYGPFKRFYAD